MSFWRAKARARIAELTKDLPADATLDQRRKVLRGKGWSGGWAQKAWVKEVRAYLERHGAPPRPGPSPVFPDHVHFPFREERS
ncbi:MAG: hypothetical protein MUF47_00805 [Porphyrobacter sp.]|jgi:hypothetical protein|nr:hypothetical protein [Porphyrobacter sp.]